MTQKKRIYVPALFVALATFLLYAPALRNGFVLWDDDSYVYANSHIRSLDWSLLRWAFTDMVQSYWHPIAKVSHAIDYALWGLWPFGHHLTSVLIHGMNAFLVVLVGFGLLRATQRREDERREQGRSGWSVFAAAVTAGVLFGIHPLHVESVAWVSERKDLLCALFFLLSVLAYIRYAAPAESEHARGEQAWYGKRTYWMSFGAFLFALASKPMAVSLPAVLLLLDWYPLGRSRERNAWKHLLIEKIPYAVCGLVVAFVTIAAQGKIGALSTFEEAPVAVRILSVFKTVALYLGKLVLPIHLSPLYPFDKGLSISRPDVLISLIVVAGITLACILSIKHKPALAAAWAYFLVTVMPTTSIIQFGYQAMADRFIYLPCIGPLLLAGVMTARGWERTKMLRNGRWLFLAGIAAIASGYAVLTVQQIGVWKNSIVLWDTVIQRAPDRIPIAYNNRGLAWQEQGRFDLAVQDFSKAIALDPTANQVYMNRGIARQQMGQTDRAVEDLIDAIRIKPDYADAYTSLGWLYGQAGRIDLALRQLDKAIDLDPGNALAYNHRAMLLRAEGKFDQALAAYGAAIAARPRYADSYVNRALLFSDLGRNEEAIRDYTAAISVDSGCTSAYNNRGLLYAAQGRRDRALGDFTDAIRSDPYMVEAYNNRAMVFEEQGRLDRALRDYDAAIAVRPDDFVTYSNRGIVHLKMNQIARAVEDQTRAIELSPGYGPAYLYRGDGYRALGRNDDALMDYRKACSLGEQAACAAVRRSGRGTGGPP